jgi:hypothetical protein
VSTSRAFGLLVAIILAAAVLAAGCYRSDYEPVLDVALSPAVGGFRSPSFSMDSSSAYAISIGTEAVPVDEATCRAAAYSPWVIERADKLGKKLAPCHMLTPSVGAISWKLTRDGTMVAQGSEGALPPSAWFGRSNTLATREPIAWQALPTEFCAPAGENYVLELVLKPSPVPLEQFHPRIGITKDWKRTSPSCADSRVAVGASARGT